MGLYYLSGQKGMFVKTRDFFSKFGAETESVFVDSFLRSNVTDFYPIAQIASINLRGVGMRQPEKELYGGRKFHVQIPRIPCLMIQQGVQRHGRSLGKDGKCREGFLKT